MGLSDLDVEAIAQKVANGITGRKPIVAGNWKMHKTPAETEALIHALAPLIRGVRCDVVVAPPFVCLDRANLAIGNQGIGLSAQNMYWAPQGAFTGEISANMLKELGVAYVIVGHSERRQYFGETNQTVGRRARAVVDADMTPIMCVGEQLEEREQGRMMEVVTAQVEGALAGLTGEEVARSIVAYEPVWAIGTGKTASAQQAQEAHAAIRQLIADLHSSAVADRVRIQYGGSVKPANAAELLSRPDIDGALVGGAALKAEDFAAICRATGTL